METQIAGVRCKQCNRRCVSDDDGAACECGAVLHREDCWRDHWMAEHQKDPYREAPRAPKARPRTSEAQGERGDQGELFCAGCARWVSAPTTLDILGFPKFTCPKCGTGGKLPLTARRRLAYQIILGILGTGIVVAAFNGIIASPGLLGIAIIVALVKDSSLRSETLARELARARPEPRKKRRER